MIGIREIASFLPPGRVSNIDRREAAGKDEAFIRDKIGFEQLARTRTRPGNIGPVRFRVRRTPGRPGFDPAQVDCVVVCTQNPDAHGLPHTSPWSTANSGLASGRQFRHLAGLLGLCVRAVGGHCIHGRQRPALRPAVHRRPLFQGARRAGLGHRTAFRRCGDGDVAGGTAGLQLPSGDVRQRRLDGPFHRRGRGRRPPAHAGQQRVQVQHDRGAGADAGLPRAGKDRRRPASICSCSTRAAASSSTTSPASSAAAEGKCRSKPRRPATPCPRRCR